TPDSGPIPLLLWTISASLSQTKIGEKYRLIPQRGSVRLWMECGIIRGKKGLCCYDYTHNFDELVVRQFATIKHFEGFYHYEPNQEFHSGRKPASRNAGRRLLLVRRGDLC